MKIVGLIPARGGSKGIPNKNMAMCGGRPLIAHTFAAAKAAGKLDRVFLSTDEKKIAKFAEEQGIEVPFLRPKHLSGDETPMIDVIRHFIAWLDSQKIAVDGVLLLQPTSPLRKACHIDEAIALFEEKEPTSLVSVVAVPHNFTPTSIMQLDNGTLSFYSETRFYRRQDKPIFFARNGPALLIVTRQAIEQNHCYASPCLAYIMDYFSSVDVDDHDSLRLADMLLKNLTV